MSNASVGRHRPAQRYNPLTELATIVSRSGSTSAKTTSVLAASGGLVAALALPANASASSPMSPASDAPASTQAAVSAAPAVQAPAAPAPMAHVVAAPLAFTAVAKPKPKPKPVVVRTETPTQASRSTTRTPVAAAPKATSNPAPRVASGGVLDIARSLSGIYYVYGGTTPAGFDCSGFTSYVFRQVGINLPRTAAQQQAYATPVSNPQPGDLVFAGSPAYHVGIYAGNGMMYDSPTTGKTTGLRKIWASNPTYGRVL